jgi:mono/diheme cytochrome c family protein
VAQRRRQRTGTAARSGRGIWIGVAVVVVAAASVMGFFVIPTLTEQEFTTAEIADTWEMRCSTCHGMQGEGQLGPQLGDGAVVDAYPDIDDQIEVITEGRNGMPPFGQVMDEDEIRALAEYTREVLGTDDQPGVGSD